MYFRFGADPLGFAISLLLFVSITVSVTLKVVKPAHKRFSDVL